MTKSEFVQRVEAAGYSFEDINVIFNAYTLYKGKKEKYTAIALVELCENNDAKTLNNLYNESLELMRSKGARL